MTKTLRPAVAIRTTADDVVDAIHRRFDEVSAVTHGEITIKIQDGRPVFMDITTKHKL
jgi:hypothetical protein